MEITAGHFFYLINTRRDKNVLGENAYALNQMITVTLTFFQRFSLYV